MSNDAPGNTLAPPDPNIERIPIGGLGTFTIDDYVKGPSPLHPPGQGQIGGGTPRSIRQDFFSSHPENKPILDPNAHISCASHAREAMTGPQRRLSENSLAPSHHSSVHTDHTGRLGPTLAPGPSSSGIMTPMDYMQPTGHMLDHPHIETPVALDQTLVDFIKTMEQSESEWANFILSAGDSQNDHGMENGQDGMNGNGHDMMRGGGPSHDGGQQQEHMLNGGSGPGHEHRSGMDVDYRSHGGSIALYRIVVHAIGADILHAHRAGHIASHLLAGTSKGAGDSIGQGSIPSHTLSSIASQSHVTSSLAGTSLPSWIWVHVPVLIDVSRTDPLPLVINANVLVLSTLSTDSGPSSRFWGHPPSTRSRNPCCLWQRRRLCFFLL